jgi:hypothetical protein
LSSWCLECARKDNRDRNRLRRSGTVDLDLTPRQCLGCLKDFTPWRRDQQHCSDRRCHQWTGNLKVKYGISPGEYRKLLNVQGGACAICQRTDQKRLAVDHCHETGKIRALLCQRCNLVLGQVEDDPVLLEKMGQFLIAHRLVGSLL